MYFLEDKDISIFKRFEGVSNFMFDADIILTYFSAILKIKFIKLIKSLVLFSDFIYKKIYLIKEKKRLKTNQFQVEKFNSN